MEIIQAVNTILPALGEHLVTEVDVVNPTVNLIINNMDLKRKELLAKGWWFNTKKIKLFPNDEKQIKLPTDTLSVFSSDAVQDGDFLVHVNTLSSTFDKGVDVVLYVDKEFNRLPEYAAYVVLYEALVQMYQTDIGKEPIVADWQQKGMLNLSQLSAQHLRNKNYSTLKSPKMRRIIGSLSGY